MKCAPNGENLKGFKMFEVTQVAGKGRGCVATKSIAKGEVIGEEEPAVVAQSPLNHLSSWCCAHCLAPLGSLRSQLTRLGIDLKGGDPPLLETGAADAPLSGPPVCCPTCERDGGVGAWYCSEACRGSDWATRHGAFCSASPEHRQAAKAFRDFADSHLHTLHLAADMAAASWLADVVISKEGQRKPLSAAASSGSETAAGAGAPPAWLEVFCHGPWSSLVPLLEEVPEDEEGDYRASCEKEASKGLKLFLKTIELAPTAESPAANKIAQNTKASGVSTPRSRLGWLTPSVWQLLLGAITQNSWRVSLTSPLRDYVSALAALPPEQVPSAKDEESAPANKRARATDKTVFVERGDFAKALRVAVGRVAAELEANEEAPDGSDDSGDEASSSDDEAGEGSGGSDEETPGGRPEDVERHVSVLSIPEEPSEVFEWAQSHLPDTEGTGLFCDLAMLNHSCTPNATVEWLGQTAAAALVALRPIRPGEEITVAYIPLDEPLDARRRALHEYGFLCDCQRCAQEGGS